MKKALTIAAALSVAASATFANPNYPVEVTKDGVLYNCASDLVVIDGVQSRKCVTAGGSSEAGGGLFALGLGGFGAVGLGILGIVFVGVALDDDDDTTNGTN
ncbi:MAG: hypothetical protein HKP51_03095 [Sulfitobacter sp.]|nr:hypothetical protein [Sulfitobacter sp.]